MSRDHEAVREFTANARYLSALAVRATRRFTEVADAVNEHDIIQESHPLVQMMMAMKTAIETLEQAVESAGPHQADRSRLN